MKKPSSDSDVGWPTAAPDAAHLSVLRERLVKAGGTEDLSPLAMGKSAQIGREGWSQQSVWEGDEQALHKLQEENYKALSQRDVFQLETIVERQGRPVAFVKKGSFADLATPWDHLNLEPIRARIEQALPAVGTVQVFSGNGQPGRHIGTAFLVAPGMVMTNRHTAEVFVDGVGEDGKRLSFKPGLTAGINFDREFDFDPSDLSRNVRIIGIRMVHPFWDMALFEIEDSSRTIAPLTLSPVPPEDLVGHEIVVIGYPSAKVGSDPVIEEIQEKVFEHIFEVKRVAPGEVMGRQVKASYGHGVPAMLHDSSTIAGFSGSPVIDLGTGHVVAMHFKGEFLQGNYSVPMYELARDPRVVDAGLNFVAQLPATKDLEPYWDAAEAGQRTPAGEVTRTSPATAGSTSSAPVRPDSEKITPFADGEIAARLARMEQEAARQETGPDLNTRLRHAAAVLAAFNLADLLPSDGAAAPGEAAARMALMIDLVPNPYSGRQDLHWSLGSGARKRILRELNTAAAIQQALAANYDRVPDLPVQQVLTRSIRMQQPFDIAKMEAPELSLLATVADWLEGTEPGGRLPNPAALRVEIESRRDRNLLGRLTSDSFTGRKAEQALIRSHLENSKPEVLFVAGQGGMGKSALVSKVLLDWEQPGSPVAGAGQKLWVRIDMDHSMLNPEEPGSVLRHAAEQLRRTRPDFSSLLSSFLDESQRLANRQAQSLESISDADWDYQLSLQRFIEILQRVLVFPEDRIVLWLDTFEEAQFLGESVAARLLGGLAMLSEELHQARVVVTGRALPPELEEAKKQAGAHPDATQPDRGLQVIACANPSMLGLELKELPRPTAGELLGVLAERASKPATGAGLSKTLIGKAAEALGGNPLTLRLAAPVLVAEGKSGLRSLSKITHEVRQKQLLSRIVAHLHDATLEKLILPGLELRVITPGVIREVLAKPCKLGELSEAESGELFECLRRELTLVEPANDGTQELRYRQEIRLIILRRHDGKLSGQARQIHTRARDWWKKLTGPVARAEELYHRLRLSEEPADLDPSWDDGAAPLMRSTLEELPAGSAGRLWLAGKLGVVLGVQESASANQVTWEQQTAAEVQRLLAERKPQDALAVLASRDERLPGSSLYALESRARLFTGDDCGAVATAWRGIASCREESKAVAVDLALLAGFINERNGNFKLAREAVTQAVRIARPTRESMLMLRAELRARRLRRLAVGKQEQYTRFLPAPSSSLVKAAQSVSEYDLRANPTVLRELAAEIGVAYLQYLRLACDVLLDDLLASLSVAGLTDLMEKLRVINAKERSLLSIGSNQLELVKLARGRCEEYLHQPESRALLPFYHALQELFRQSVDVALRRDYAPPEATGDALAKGRGEKEGEAEGKAKSMGQGKVDTMVKGSEKPPGNRGARPSLLVNQLAKLIANAPADWLDTIARHVLDDDIARLGYGLSKEAIAREIIKRADEFQRLPELIESVGVLMGGDSKIFKMIRRSFDKWYYGEKAPTPVSPPWKAYPQKTLPTPNLSPMKKAAKKKSGPITMDELQQEVLEGNISTKELGTYFIELPPDAETLEPKFILNPEKVVVPAEEVTLESALLMNTANKLFAWQRKVAYEKKIKKGGPNLIRVIAEGDSWFQYPKILWDVIDKLSERPDLAIRCFSAAGDVLSNMTAHPQFVEAIRSEKPKYFLLSGGGNDLVDGQGLRLVLKKYDPKLKPAQYLNDNYTAFKARITRLYKDILTLIFRESPTIHVICHGYAYAIPDSKRGPWLGKPMEELGIKDRTLQFSIMKVIVDDIQSTIKAGIAQATDGTSFKASFVDNRKTIPTEGACWHDEFHPTDEYFAKVADKIGKLIK